MFCKDCGAEIDHNAKVCPVCGNATHKGKVQKKIWKWIALSGGIFAVFLVVLIVLFQTGFFRRIQEKREAEKFAVEQENKAEKILKNFEIQAVGIHGTKGEGTLAFEEESVYLVDGSTSSKNVLAFSKEEKFFRSEGEGFSDSGVPVMKREVFQNLLETIGKTMEYQSGKQKICLKGEADGLEDVFNTLLDFNALLTGKSDSVEKTGKAEYTINVQNQENIDATLKFGSRTFELNLLAGDMESPVSVLSDAVYYDNEEKSQTLQGTFFCAENNTEILIEEDCLTISDDFEPMISASVNGKQTTIPLKDLSMISTGLQYEGQTYPSGTKEQYEEEQEELAEINQQNEEELAQFKKYVKIAKEYSVDIGFKETSLFSEDKYYTDSSRYKVTINKLEREVDDDGYQTLKVKGEIDDGEDIQTFEGDVDAARDDYVLITLDDDYDVGKYLVFSSNKVVGTYFENFRAYL